MTENVLNRRLLPNVAPVLQLSFTMRLQKVGLNPTLLAGLVLISGVFLWLGLRAFDRRAIS